MKIARSAHRRWALALALPMVATIAVPAIMVGQTLEARFVERTNQVEYSPAGSSQWQPAPADVALGPGDRLRTAANSAARVAFFDGTTTALGPTTGLRVEGLDAADRQIRLSQTAG